MEGGGFHVSQHWKTDWGVAVQAPQSSTVHFFFMLRCANVTLNITQFSLAPGPAKVRKQFIFYRYLYPSSVYQFSQEGCEHCGETDVQYKKKPHNLLTCFPKDIVEKFQMN